MSSKIAPYFIKCTNCEGKLEIGFGSSPGGLADEIRGKREVQCKFCGARVPWSKEDLFTA